MKERRKMKIVLFADVLEENFDGVSITLHKILNSFPQDQFDVLVITPHPPVFEESIPFIIHTCAYLKVPFQKGYRLAMPNKRSLYQLLDAFLPDLIHFTSPSMLGYHAIKYGKKRDIPVMNIYHTHYPVYLKYYAGRIGDWLLGPMLKGIFVWLFYKRSDLTLVPTKTIMKDLVKLGVPAHKMQIWGRAIKADNFSPKYRDANTFDLVVPHENKKVLFVSRLIKEKETKTLHKVYRKLKKADKNVTMIITGDGPKRDWLESKMRKAVFTGKKTGGDLAKIYASSDVFFFPSASETFGNVIIEAMASGLPVVSADAGGPSDLVKNENTGFLVKTGKAKEFTKKILQILNDDDLRVQMSQNAVEYIQSHSLESLHQQLWMIYQTLIQESRDKKAVADYQQNFEVTLASAVTE